MILLSRQVKLILIYYVMHVLIAIVYAAVFSAGFFILPELLYLFYAGPLGFLVAEVYYLGKIRRLWVMHLLLGWVVAFFAFAFSIFLFFYLGILNSDLAPYIFN